MFYFFFFQKAERDRLKKTVGQNFVISLLFLLPKIGSVGPIDQQMNLVSPKVYM